MNPIFYGHTALFSPADRPDRATKALKSNADIVILDLEDAVAPTAKTEARGMLENLLSAAAERNGIAIRINDPATDIGHEDLAELNRLRENPKVPEFAIMIPKLTTNTPLASLPEKTAVIGLIETAHGVRDLYEIATTPQIQRLALGAVDLSVELGCEPHSPVIDTVRAQLVIASAAATLPAPLDSPCLDFRNAEIMEQAATYSRRDGFGGLLCIHPAQLEPVITAFQPSRTEVDWARKVLDMGDAAASLNGQMIDRPVIMRAQRILDATTK